MKTDGKEAALPSKFGRYQLVERLATGGMAEVFKAKILASHGFEKLLVIKRILPHLAKDKTFVSMFIDEAKLTAQLVHPKIVQVTDFGEVEGQYFIALEFVDGFDALALLRASAQRQVRLPIPITVFLVMEVLDALDYAHNARDREGRPMRLVHRDISPSNIFISRRGDVKLGDFGIAHAQERESKTQAGTLKGKYGYMSPEQVVGGALDGRSDLFAVGIVLAEMLMGRRLFTAATDLDVLLMVRDGRLERLDKYCRDIPPELDRIVRRSLKKRLTERYQTAAEFRDALADLLFRHRLRVSPHDIGTIAADYFNPSPDALVRLKEHGRRWEMKPIPVTDEALRNLDKTIEQPLRVSFNTSPAASDSATDLAASSQVSTAELVRPTEPDTRPQPSGRSREPTSPDGELDVFVDLGDDGDRGRGPSPVPARRTTPAPSPVATARAAVRVETSPRPSGAEAKVAAAMQQVLSQPMAVVNLDQYEAPAARAQASAAVPATATHAPAPATQAPAATGSVLSFGGPSSASLSQAAPSTSRPPDSAGDLAMISPMRVFADLAAAQETGLVRFEIAPHIKEVYLVRGAPQSVNSSLPADRFGEYLVARGFLRAMDLENALAQAHRYAGKLGDTLVGLGLMRPLDVFRLLSQQVRERVMEVFAWRDGYFAFYRGVRNPQEAFPLGLDTYEILGAGVLTLPYEFLERRFSAHLDHRPRSKAQLRITPDAFRLGPTPRDLCALLDGTRTLREWAGRFAQPAELLTFLRTLYLLIETDLAHFE